MSVDSLNESSLSPEHSRQHKRWSILDEINAPGLSFTEAERRHKIETVIDENAQQTAETARHQFPEDEIEPLYSD